MGGASTRQEDSIFPPSLSVSARLSVVSCWSSGGFNMSFKHKLQPVSSSAPPPTTPHGSHQGSSSFCSPSCLPDRPSAAAQGSPPCSSHGSLSPGLSSFWFSSFSSMLLLQCCPPAAAPAQVAISFWLLLPHLALVYSLGVFQ